MTASPTRVLVVPISDHPPAVAATIRTLKMIPMCEFETDGELDGQGRIVGTAAHPGMLRDWVLRQGYAKGVIIPRTGPCAGCAEANGGPCWDCYLDSREANHAPEEPTP